jgi:hypothetical protein
MKVCVLLFILYIIHTFYIYIIIIIVVFISDPLKGKGKVSVSRLGGR